MCKLVIHNIGLIFSFAGGILVAISVGIHPHGAYTTLNGIKMPMAVIKSTLKFQIGIWLMIFGFLIGFAIPIIVYIRTHRNNNQ